MITLAAKIRKAKGKKTQSLRKKEIIPAVLYGPKIKEGLSLEVSLKEFEKVFKRAGESSLISLVIEGGKKENLVLIHDLKKDPVTMVPLHVDFYQPSLEKEITALVPLVFEGEAPGVKDLGATLVKNIQAVEVKALPQNLPHEIKVDVGNLKKIEDLISVEDLCAPEGVKITKNAEEIVVFLSLPEKIEEEAKPAPAAEAATGAAAPEGQAGAKPGEAKVEKPAKEEGKK